MGLEQVHYAATVGMPSVRTPPCGLGISTFRTACGMYSPAHSACLTFAQCALSHGFNSATVSLSTPGAPSFATTRSYAPSMLLRSTTASISRDASGFVSPAATDPASAPAPDPGRFRLPSPSWAVLAYASALSARIEICCPTPVFHVRPFAISRPLLWPRLTSGHPSQHLSMSAALQQTARSPRLSRTHLPAYACRIYVAAFRARTGLHKDLPAYPAAPPLSASCSSGQRFACSFLPIPSRDGHRCRSANTSPCRVCRGLSPPSECALPGAQMKSAGGFPPALRHAELPEFGRLLHHDLVSARVQGSLNTNALAFEFFHFVLMIDVIGLTRIVLQNVFVSLLYDRT